MKKRSELFFLILFLGNIQLGAISLVFNMKVRRLFNLDTVLADGDTDAWLPTAVPVVSQRRRTFYDDQKKNSIKQRRLSFGSVFNIRYIASAYWWAEVTTALQKERFKECGAVRQFGSRIGFDDIVYSFGRQFYPANNTQLALYGIGSFPTRIKVLPIEERGVLVGTRLFSLGFGSEISYQLMQKSRATITAVAQGRFLHFFKRDWQTILGPGGKIEPGNQTDLLCALRTFAVSNVIDAGYNVTFFTNSALIRPERVDKQQAIIRNSFFFSVSHIFNMSNEHRPFLIGAGFFIGRSDRFSAKTATAFLNITTLL